MPATTPLGERLAQFRRMLAGGQHPFACLATAATWRVQGETRELRDLRAGALRLPPARGTCFACDRRPATVQHHIVALSHGGRNVRGNLVPLCLTCHVRLKQKRRKPAPVPHALADRPVAGPPRLVKRPAASHPPGKPDP